MISDEIERVCTEIENDLYLPGGGVATTKLMSALIQLRGLAHQLRSGIEHTAVPFEARVVSPEQAGPNVIRFPGYVARG